MARAELHEFTFSTSSAVAFDRRLDGDERVSSHLSGPLWRRGEIPDTFASTAQERYRVRCGRTSERRDAGSGSRTSKRELRHDASDLGGSDSKLGERESLRCGAGSQPCSPESLLCDADRGLCRADGGLCGPDSVLVWTDRFSRDRNQLQGQPLQRRVTVPTQTAFVPAQSAFGLAQSAFRDDTDSFRVRAERVRIHTNRLHACTRSDRRSKPRCFFKALMYEACADGFTARGRRFLSQVGNRDRS